VGAVELSALSRNSAEESSTTIRARVQDARARQHARYVTQTNWRVNADAAGSWLLSHGEITPDARTLLDTAAERLGLSARAYHRALRVARTIADLDGAGGVGESAVAEALRYRPVRA
jgi:magnesium chelatase family protein